MKINKKTKLALLIIGLTGLVAVPTTIALTSCSSDYKEDNEKPAEPTPNPDPTPEKPIEYTYFNFSDEEKNNY